jgi:hypothetical protein
LTGLVEAANRQLKQFGVPTITLGQYSIEPVFALAIMLALLFFGFPGLLIVGFVSFCCIKTNVISANDFFKKYLFHAQMFLVHQLSKSDSQLGATIGRTLGLYDSNRAVRTAPQSAATARNQMCVFEIIFFNWIFLSDRSHPKNSSVTETKRQQSQQQQMPGASGQPQANKPFSGAGVRLGN